MKSYLKTLFTILLAVAGSDLRAQPTYHEIAQDTIVTLRQFPRNAYLLNGKKLSLPVMHWFMADYQSAADQADLAVLSNQLSVAGYSVGSVFLLTGILVSDQNKRLSNNLFGLGAIGMGAGLVFQLLSQGHEKKAVRRYNLEIKALYRSNGNAAHPSAAGPSIAVLRIRF